MFSQGQKPSHRPQHTDWTKGQFGWVLSNFSKQSTLIGVTILNKLRFSLIVRIASVFSNSDSGTLGSGLAYSVQVARQGGVSK